MSNLWFRIQVFPPRARVSKIRSLCRPQHKKSNPLAPSAQKLEPCGARGPKACTLCRPRHKNLNPLPSAAKKLETFAAQGPESRTLCRRALSDHQPLEMSSPLGKLSASLQGRSKMAPGAIYFSAGARFPLQCILSFFYATSVPGRRELRN